MSILVRYTPGGPVSTETYDSTITTMEGQGDWPPDGLEYHVAFMVDGALRVSEIWSSQGQWEAFGERLMPVLEEHGIDPGTPEILEVHNTITG